MTNLATGLHQASGVQFGALVSEAAGTAGVPKFWRAANVTGDYGDARVVLYDQAGNPLLVADDAAFTPGTTRVVPVGFLADETAPDQVDEGDIGAPRMTLSRVLRNVPSTAAGADLLGQATMAASVPVVLASNQSAVPVSAAALPLPAGAATEATLGTTNTEVGAVAETAPATDTASSGLNGRLQRVAQRLTSLIGVLPASLGQKAMAASLAVVLPNDQFGAAAAPAAATAYPTTTVVRAVPMLDNGATLDPETGNAEATAMASSARTTASGTGPLPNRNCRGVMLYLSITAKTAGTTFTITVNAVNPLTAAHQPYAVSPAFASGATSGTYVFILDSGALNADVSSAAVAAARSLPVPRTFSITVTPSDANSATYSVTYSLIR